MKEKWVEEVMQSIDNLNSVEVSESLNTRILKQVPVVQRQFVALNKPIKWAMAACLLLLIGLNSMTILHYNKVRRMENELNAKSQVYAEFFSPPIEY